MPRSSRAAARRGASNGRARSVAPEATPVALTLVRCVTARIRASPTPLLSRPPPPGACFRVRGARFRLARRARRWPRCHWRARLFAAAAGGRRAARAPLDRDGVDVVRVRARLECLDGLDTPGRSVVSWVGSGRVGSRSVRRPPWRVWSGLVWSGLVSGLCSIACAPTRPHGPRARPSPFCTRLCSRLRAGGRRRLARPSLALSSLVSRLTSLVSRLSSLVSRLSLSRSFSLSSLSLSRLVLAGLGLPPLPVQALARDQLERQRVRIRQEAELRRRRPGGGGDPASQCRPARALLLAAACRLCQQSAVVARRAPRRAHPAVASLHAARGKCRAAVVVTQAPLRSLRDRASAARGPLPRRTAGRLGAHRPRALLHQPPPRKGS